MPYFFVVFYMHKEDPRSSWNNFMAKAFFYPVDGWISHKYPFCHVELVVANETTGALWTWGIKKPKDDGTNESLGIHHERNKKYDNSRFDTPVVVAVKYESEEKKK